MEWRIQTQLVALRENSWGSARRVGNRKKSRFFEGFRLGFREPHPVEIPLFSPEKRAHREKPFRNGAAALDPATWPPGVDA
jgi:hypothetical protein